MCVSIIYIVINPKYSFMQNDSRSIGTKYDRAGIDFSSFEYSENAACFVYISRHDRRRTDAFSESIMLRRQLQMIVKKYCREKTLG